MQVEQIMPRARQRLATLPMDGPVRDAARLMAEPPIDLVVICEADVMAGLVTKTDIVSHLRRNGFGPCFDARLDAIMTRQVTSCRASDPLPDLWLMMSRRRIHRVPVVDSGGRPVGVVYGSDALQAMLQEAQIEDEQLHDYIMGIGYR
jgi:CBS domain-containing protein